MQELVTKLQAGQDLSKEEAKKAALALASTDCSTEVKSGFLTALSLKGETGEEVAAIAAAFRDLVRDPQISPAIKDRAIDVCGTGGDHSGSFNISTTVAFILASAGVPVIKHGNRSITSKCGSSQFLEAVGIATTLPAEKNQIALETINLTFLFAPAYHPAFKEIMPVRQALAQKGQRTVFNLLGPLINPGQPAHQLMGIFSPIWVDTIAGALHQLGLKAGLVVHGLIDGEPGKGMDELSTAGNNRVAGFGKFVNEQGIWQPADLGLSPCQASDLKGGDVEENKAILELLLSGQAKDGLSDTVVLNAGSALWIAGKADGLKSGMKLARQQLLGGAVREWLQKARDFYASQH